MLSVVFLLIGLMFSSCKEELRSKKVNQDFKLIVEKIKKYDNNKEINKTKFHLARYLKEALESENFMYIGKAYYRYGIYYSKFNQMDSAYYYYNKAIPFFIEIKDSIRLGKTHLNVAYLESGFQDYIKSNKTTIKALTFFNGRNEEYISNAYNCLAINARALKKEDKSIEFFERALKYSKKRKNILAYKNNIANIYKDKKEYSNSIRMLESILKDTVINSRTLIRARIIDNLAYTKWLQDSTINVISDLHLAESIRIAEKDKNGLIASYAHLADYYKKLNKVKALMYAYKMRNVAKKEKSPYDVIEALDKIKILEKPEKSILIANRRSVLKDSIELAKDNTQDKYALIKYESEENEKEAAENKLLAEQQKSQKQLWIFTVILTILFSIVYFFYKREKTKKEKAIEVYNTETRLSKKIHDELANDVYAVMNTLQNKAETDTKLLVRVEKIYAQTRDISHENSPVLTGEHFESFLKQLFIDFTNDACKVIHRGLKEVIVNELPKEKQIVLYRVLRELLVNMKKHSEASLVLITFSLSKKMLSVVYQDNGRGVKSLSIKNGLQNMETRIKSVGGIITFESKQEKGFQAKFHFKK